MMLIAVLFCITCFKITLSLPPSLPNFNNNKNVINPQNKNNQRFLQYKQDALLRDENVGLQKRHNYPQFDKNLDIASHSAYTRAYAQNNIRYRPAEQNIGIAENQFELPNREQFLQRQVQNPNINQNSIVAQNIERGLNERESQQLKQLNIASNPLQNFQINLRGYILPPGINNALVPPKPNLPKPFSTIAQDTKVVSTQSMIQPPTQENREILNSAYVVKIPIFQQQTSKLTDLHTPVSTPSTITTPKKTYTIIYPNGTTEQSDSLEAIKKNFPYYILRHASDVNVNHKFINEDYLASEKGVTAKDALANPTLVPIFNLPPPVSLPEHYPKETLVTNTLSDQTQRRLTPSLVTEQLKTNTSNFDKKYSTVSSNSNINISTGSVLLSNTLKNDTVDTNESFTPLPPLVNDTSNKLSTIINKTDNKEDQNINNVSLENINADEFWSPVKNIVQFPNLSNLTDTDIRINSLDQNNKFEEIQPFDGHLDTNLTSAKENEFTTINKLNNTFLRENKTDDVNFSSEDSQLALSITSNDSENIGSEIEDEQILYDSEEARIDEFVHSIEDMIEFIEPFVQTQNDTEENETNFDNDPENINDTNNESNLNFNDISKITLVNQNTSEPIYIPNLSSMKDNDTMFWFKTTDDNVWEKLSRENGTNLFVISPPISLEKDRIITMFPNGTKFETITEITRSDNGNQPIILKTTTITKPNGEMEIKYS